MSNRRMWIGVVTGVLAAMVVVSVAAGAYHAGQRSEPVTQVAGDGGAVGEPDGVVRIVGGHGWGYGPGRGSSSSRCWASCCWSCC